MKMIKIMLVIASLFAIVGAAFFQLFVLLTSKLSATHNNDRRTLKAG